MATKTPPSNVQKPPGKGGNNVTSPIGGGGDGAIVGAKIHFETSSGIKETGKDFENTFKDINKSLRDFTERFDKRLDVLTKNLKNMDKTTGEWSTSIRKMEEMISSLGEKTQSKIAESSKKTTESIKTAATEASIAVKESTAATEEGSKKTKKALKEVDDQAKETTKTFSTFSEKLKAMAGPAVAQGLTASFGIFFNVIGRLKEYDTYLGQLHTKITNTNGDLKKYQATLLDQSVVGMNELSFGLTPEQRKEAMGSFATFASESEKYSKSTAGNIKGLTEGAAGLFKGIGIPIAEASATLMDLHKKLGLTYAEMEKFALSTTAVYRQSNMTTDQFKKLLDVLPNVARAYGLSTKASQEFVSNSLEVGKALAAVGLDADDVLAKMNRMSEGSEEALIQSMMLNLKVGDAKGNQAKFAAGARDIYNQTGGDNANEAELFLRRKRADSFGYKEFSLDQITAMAKGGKQEKDGKLTEQTVEQNLKEASKSLENAAIKYERPFVTLDQQISQFFTEMETRIVRKFSEAVVDFKKILGDFGAWIKKAVDFIDKITGGSGWGIGGLGMASLIAGFIVGPLVAGVVRAISNALGVGRLGQLLLSLVGLGRFNPLLGATTGSVGTSTTAVATVATAATVASKVAPVAEAATGVTTASSIFGAGGATIASVAAVVGQVLLTLMAGYAVGTFLDWAWDKFISKKTEKINANVVADNERIKKIDKWKESLSSVTDKETKDLAFEELNKLDLDKRQKARMEGRLDVADLSAGKSYNDLEKLHEKAAANLAIANKQYKSALNNPAFSQEQQFNFSLNQERLRGSKDEISERMTKEIKNIIREEAIAEGVDPEFLTKLIGIESSFNPKSVNTSTDARGLGNLTPGARQDVNISDEDAYDPRKNARGSAKYAKLKAKELGADISANSSSIDQQLARAGFFIGTKNLKDDNRVVYEKKDASGKRKRRDLETELNEDLQKMFPDNAMTWDQVRTEMLRREAEKRIGEGKAPRPKEELQTPGATQTSKPSEVAVQKQNAIGETAGAIGSDGYRLNITTASGKKMTETRGNVGTSTDSIEAPSSSAVKGENITIPATEAVVASDKTQTPSEQTVSPQNAVTPPKVKTDETNTLKEVHDRQSYSVLREIASLLKQNQQPVSPVAYQQPYNIPFKNSLNDGLNMASNAGSSPWAFNGGAA